MKLKWFVPTVLLMFGCAACDDNKDDERSRGTSRTGRGNGP